MSDAKMRILIADDEQIERIVLGRKLVKLLGSDSGYEIIIADDGVGFDYEQVKAEIASGKRDSTGMQNLIFRFEKMLKAKVDVKSTIGVGSTITITFPAKR